MNSPEAKESRETDLKCDFIIVSAVKKLIHSKERRCSPEFLKALDASVSATVRKACDAANGGAKTLGEELLLSGTCKAASAEPAGIRAAYDEVICLDLQINVQTKQEFRKRVAAIKSLLEPFLGAK